MSNEGRSPGFGILERLLPSLRSRHTLRSHIWQSLANYTQQGFGLVFGIVLARLLAPSDFGAYGLALATVALALLPAMWSLAPTLLADSGRTPHLFNLVASFTWSIIAVRAAIVSLIAIWLFATGNKTMASLSVLIGLTETFREFNNVQKGLLEGAGRFEPNFVSVTANMIFCIVIVIPFCYFVYRGPYILTLPPLGMVLTDFVIYRLCSRRSVLVRPHWSAPKGFFQSGFWLWLNSISEIGLGRSDKWFVGRFLGDATLGHYSRAFGYAPLGFMALNSFATNPTISGLARHENPDARLRLFLRTALILLLGGVLNWLIFFPFAREIVLWLFGPQWESTVPIFRAFASLSLAYAITYLPITALYAQKKYQEVAVVRVVVLILFLSVLFLYRRNLSAIFVAWLLQAALLAQGIILLFIARSIFQRQPTASFNA